MIRSGESLKVVMSLDGSRVFTLRVSDGRGVLCHFALHNIITDIPAE